MTKFIHFVILSLLLCAGTLSRSGTSETVKTADVVLIGGGIMSASVGSMLLELEPDLNVEVYERLDRIAGESSYAWNNAGTGHSGFCELNYTPASSDGTIDISKAVRVNEDFEVSKQYWAHLSKSENLSLQNIFIKNVPHMNLVIGDHDINFLKTRYQTMVKHPLFSRMVYTEDRKKIEEWAPLLTKNRKTGEKIAATRVTGGTDVNFGAVTKALFDKIGKKPNSQIHYLHEVVDITKNKNGTWRVKTENLTTHQKSFVDAKFVFIGGGGGALPLLQMTKIPESRRYAGFPVGGEWLVSDHPDVVNHHFAKVYGQASIGAPPMSVAHLDTRTIDGKKSILFGPFAVYSTKFLKYGSNWDLLSSVKPYSVVPMVQIGLNNFSLLKYLITQVMLSHEDKIDQLKRYYPEAKSGQWKELKAGQRVQIIKIDPEKGSVLQFGTEIVGSQDGSIVALLGASPGASTSVKIALDVLNKAFPDKVKTKKWESKLIEMIPSYGKKIADDPELQQLIGKRNHQYLGLEF